MELQQENKRLKEHYHVHGKCSLTLDNANAQCEQEEVTAFIWSSES